MERGGWDGVDPYRVKLIGSGGWINDSSNYVLERGAHYPRLEISGSLANLNFLSRK